jgi:hypothetical protein
MRLNTFHCKPDEKTGQPDWVNKRRCIALSTQGSRIRAQDNYAIPLRAIGQASWPYQHTVGDDKISVLHGGLNVLHECRVHKSIVLRQAAFNRASTVRGVTQQSDERGETKDQCAPYCFDCALHVQEVKGPGRW